MNIIGTADNDNAAHRHQGPDKKAILYDSIGKAGKNSIDFSKQEFDLVHRFNHANNILPVCEWGCPEGSAKSGRIDCILTGNRLKTMNDAKNSSPCFAQ
ncbi:hypothetical protein [Sedimenticola sp.]|uniref:hypothetical protein n=1 Tax=Sedimenticola sp. TaxID=1940285 RepID=UPI003D14460C